MADFKYKIAVLGLWHLGEIFSAGLAELGHYVVGIGEDKKLIENFLNKIPPLPEPGLEELLKKNIAAGRLNYTDDFSVIKNCNVFWLTFDTPVDENDEIDLSVVYDGLHKAIPYLQNNVLIVATSQLPVGSAKEIGAIIRKSRPDLKFEYAYVPENLRLGGAIKCFLEPGHLIAGAESESVFEKIDEIFSNLKTRILRMSLASAEMTKQARNAFLATSVCFINEIADICEKTGADILEVANGLRLDPRIGPNAFLDAGLGFSGGTLGRDVKGLKSIAEINNISSLILKAVIEKNNSRKAIVINRLREALGGLGDKTIIILGLTYKAGTRTLRRSRALEIARDLIKEGVVIRLYDPFVDQEELKSKIENPDFYADPYQASAGANALMVVTPWPEFKNLNLEQLGKIAAGAVFFDTSNFLAAKQDEITKAGFRYLGIGRN